MPGGLASGSWDSFWCSPQKNRRPIKGPFVRSASANFAETKDTGDLLTTLELPFSKSAAEGMLVSHDRNFDDLMSATARFWSSMLRVPASRRQI